MNADLAYLYTLEQLLASKRASSPASAAVANAESFLRELDALIEDDMNRYRDGETKRWPIERYDALRNEAIDHILALNSHLERPAEGSNPEAE